MFSSSEGTKANGALVICAFKSWGKLRGDDLLHIDGFSFALAFSVTFEVSLAKAFLIRVNPRSEEFIQVVT
jgi:hypothetical protein